MFDSLARLDRLERSIDRWLPPEPATPPSSNDEGLLDLIPRLTRRFTAPAHLAPLVARLERARDEPLRLVVSTPPRHGKTETLLAFIVWLLLRDPGCQVAYIGYGSQFARNKSRKARSLAQRAGVPFAKDQNAKANWRTGVGDGGLWATGIGGEITGEGFHCFPAGTRIRTENGVIPIEVLVRLPERPRVLCFDHKAKCLRYRSIEAIREVEANGLVEIRSSGGRTVRCTRDHRIFIPGYGYREASLLRIGDPLVVAPLESERGVRVVREHEAESRPCLPAVLRASAQSPTRELRLQFVREDVPKEGIRSRESATAGREKSLLLDPLSECPQRDQERKAVFPVRRADAGAEHAEVLLAGMPKNGAAVAHDDVSVLPSSFSAPERTPSVLWPALRQCCAFAADARFGQFAFQDGDELREALWRDAAPDLGARFASLRCVRNRRANVERDVDGEAGHAEQSRGASHRRESEKQQANEPDHPLQRLPSGAPQVDFDTVAVVRDLRGEGVTVFDLQVAECHNFFAEEILVHNCIVVDDPVKDRATAESPTYREHAWEAFNDNIFTRLEPGGSCIVNMARWHPDDLAGRLVDQGWTYLCLPALDDEGVPLWPGRYSRAHLEGIRAQLGEYGWASLYQGRPRSRGGAVFRDVRFYEGPIPQGARIVLGVDLAYSQRAHADYSVAVVLAEIAGMHYVLDVARAQLEPPAFAARLAHLQREHSAQAYWYGSGTEKGVASLLAGLGAPVIWKQAGTDKFIRAQKTAAAWNAGRILLPKGAPWVNDFVTELASFTGVTDPHDDQVDALVAAFDALAVSGSFTLSQNFPKIRSRM